ncbi:hypothetical protein BDQ17DRAFT_1242962 [Cyathus striatus]|nr:hypothetical protein BDQ17DRAFT_1242962 [Cyathus striatus]
MSGQGHVVASVINQARQTASLPSGWSFTGCYSDSVDSRTLRTASFTSVDSMTISSCIDFCITGNFQFAGLEFGRVRQLQLYFN